MCKDARLTTTAAAWTMAAASTAVRGGDASVSGGSPRKSSSPRRLLAGNAYRCPWRVSEGPRHLCEHGCYFVAYEPSRFLHAFTGGSRVAGLQPRVVCWLARRRAAAAATGWRWRRAGRWRRTHASGEGAASRPPCRTRSSSRPARSTYSNLPEAVQALAADRFPARREAAASVASPARSSLSNHAAGGDAVACAGGGGDGGGDDVRGRRGGAGVSEEIGSFTRSRGLHRRRARTPLTFSPAFLKGECSRPDELPGFGRYGSMEATGKAYVMWKRQG